MAWCGFLCRRGGEDVDVGGEALGDGGPAEAAASTHKIGCAGYGQAAQDRRAGVNAIEEADLAGVREAVSRHQLQLRRRSLLAG